MAAYLEISRGSAFERIPLGAHDQFTIGRHPASDLVLADPSVSRLHAVIDHLGPSWCLADVSANGTAVNGANILGRRIAISSGAAIVIGDTSIAFHEYASPIEADDETIERSTPPPTITAAEGRVLIALCRPLATEAPVRTPATVADMADRLGANFQTVKFHLRNLYAKFDIREAGSNRRALLADAAIRSGAVTLADIRRD